MIYQEPVGRELGRAAAMLTQTTGTREARCLRPGWEEELLGTSLSHYVGIAQLLWASAVHCAGRFDPASLEAPGAERICAEIPASTILSVAGKHFVTDTAAFRQANEQAQVTSDRLLRRYEYNPLRTTPLVKGYGPGLLAPVSQLVAAKASPLGIYYTGVARFGNAFAQDLGDLFEGYVGRQLGLLPEAAVLPEITYGQNRSLSVDWIVVTEELVLLVEVKSVRPTAHLRLATERRVKELQRMLGRAYEQIDNTAALIASGRKEFAQVPTDRPVQGLIVTMEPFHIVNAPLQRPFLPATTVPVTVCSISELEDMVTITDAPVGRVPLERAADTQPAPRSRTSLVQAAHGADARDVGDQQRPDQCAQRGSPVRQRPGHRRRREAGHSRREPGPERTEGGPLPAEGRSGGCRSEDLPGHLPGRTLLQRALVPAPAQAQGEALPPAARSQLTTPVSLEPPVPSDRSGERTVRTGSGLVGHDGTPDRRRSAMPTPLPALTPEQRAEALAKAGRVRKERSEMLAALKAGRLSLLDVLDRGGDTARQTRALQLLQSLPGVGTVKARRHLVDLGISETRRIQGLGARQRARLIELFPPQA